MLVDSRWVVTLSLKICLHSITGERGRGGGVGGSVGEEKMIGWIR